MQNIFHIGCIDMLSFKCVFSDILSYNYFDKKNHNGFTSSVFHHCVCSGAPRTLFLNKPIITMAAFLRFITGVYSHVIYKIIFRVFFCHNSCIDMVYIQYVFSGVLPDFFSVYNLCHKSCIAIFFPWV